MIKKISSFLLWFLVMWIYLFYNFFPTLVLTLFLLKDVSYWFDLSNLYIKESVSSKFVDLQIKKEIIEELLRWNRTGKYTFLQARQIWFDDIVDFLKFIYNNLKKSKIFEYKYRYVIVDKVNKDEYYKNIKKYEKLENLGIVKIMKMKQVSWQFARLWSFYNVLVDAYKKQ